MRRDRSAFGQRVAPAAAAPFSPAVAGCGGGGAAQLEAKEIKGILIGAGAEVQRCRAAAVQKYRGAVVQRVEGG